MNEATLALMIPIFSVTLPFVLAGVIVGLVTYYQFRKRREVQETIRLAIEKGQELPTEFLETITRPKDPPRKDRDLRRGVVLVAVGLGIAALGYFLSSADAMDLVGIGAIPFLIGLAFITLWILRTRHGK